MPDLSQEQLDELRGRLLAGPSLADLKDAVAACKPPKPEKAPKPAPDAARANLLRLNTTAAKLVKQIQNARRRIADTPPAERFKSLELSRLYAQ
ncbi:MAG: hypothetical protein ACRDHE_15695, partial [Ktedonobacterales bacterium]